MEPVSFTGWSALIASMSASASSSMGATPFGTAKVGYLAKTMSAGSMSFSARAREMIWFTFFRLLDSSMFAPAAMAKP